MVQENFDQKQVSTSKFYMIRCLIAMAHADGFLCDEELGYLQALMSRMPLTDEQRETLQSDIKISPRIEDLLPYINDPKYRGQLPYFARLMAYKDGELHPNEERLLEIMHTHAIDGLDMEAIKAEVAAAVTYEMSAHDIDMNELRYKGGLFWLIDQILLKLGIDLMRD